MNTLQVHETLRVDGIKYSENISRKYNPTVHIAESVYFGASDKKMC